MIHKVHKVTKKSIKPLVLLLVTITAGLLLFTAVPWKNGLRAYVVLSGSMKPTIGVGSLAIVQETPAKEIKQNEVVAFRDPSDVRRIIIHRVVGLTLGDKTDSRTFFTTKGDANQKNDDKKLPESLIIGRVPTSIPYLGYFLDFMRQPVGLIILLVIPCLGIAFLEFKNFKRHLDYHYENKLKKGKKTKLTSVSVKLIFLFALGSMVVGGAFGASAIFSIRAISSGVVNSGDWSISSGDVVINEMMWAGSKGNSDDEWLELRNMKNVPIDLSGWQLTKLTGEETLMLTIPEGKVIPRGGYFLVSRLGEEDSALSVLPDLVDNHLVLRNNDLQIKLYKGDWTKSENLIDLAGGVVGAPAAGVNGPLVWQSMERKDFAGDGTLSESWQTCSDLSGNKTTYWDNEGENYGTPKSANL